MLNAFTYMFKDKSFFSKFFIYTVLITLVAILPIVLKIFGRTNLTVGFLLCIMGLFLLFYITGYFISCMQNILKNEDIVNLPYVNIIADFKKGLKKSFAFFILIILIGAFSLFLIIPGAIIPYVLFLIFSFALLPAFYYIFARTEKILSFIMFKTAFNIIQEDDRKYIQIISTYIFFMILMAVFHSIAIMKLGVFFPHVFCKITVPTEIISKISLINSIVYFVFYVFMIAYSNFVNAYLFANCSDIDIE